MIRLPQDLFELIEGRGTVVVPSRQRAEAARLAYAAAALAKGQRVWRTPDVLPLEAWIGREIHRLAGTGAQLPRLLSPAEDWLLWRQAAAELTADLDLIAPTPLAEALRRADHLALEFEIEPGQPAGSEQALLVNARQIVRKRQQALGATTAAQLSATLPAVGDERPVLFTGFTPITPQLKALIAARRARGWETYTSSPQRKSGSGEEAPSLDLGPESNPRQMFRWDEGIGRVVIAGDATDELERIAEWSRLFLKRQPDARLFVMLPGAPAARQRLATLILQNLDPGSVMLGSFENSNTVVAIEGGDPLNRAPLVAHALASLRWLTSHDEFSSMSEWLRSPYWRAPDFAARSRLDLQLRARTPLEPNADDLLGVLATLPPALAPAAGILSHALTNALQHLRLGRASPREWSERFHAALDALGWQGDRALSSDEHQTCERFLDLLKELGDLTATAGSVTRDTALQWLHELAASATFRPATGDVPVTLSPSLADPIVRYDGIWVAGLHAEAWPQPVDPNPFLSLKAQIASGVPAATAIGQLKQARALMNSWAAAAGELVLSAPSRAGDMELLPSPLLKEGPTDTQTCPSVWLPLRLHREQALETFNDWRGQPWPLALPLPAGTRSLELQNECPFRAYAELRLGAQPMDAPEPGIAADERGRLLHSALEKFWRQVGDSQTLLGLPREAIDALIASCVNSAAEALWKTSQAMQRSLAQERELRRTRRLIRTLCDLEAERAPFSVTHAELESTLAVAGAQLRVRIDRVDTLAAGGLVILDYKSGRPTMADWYSERPSHVQLLTYLDAVGANACAMATVHVTARDVRFIGLTATSNLLPKVKVAEAPAGAGAADAWPLRRAEWRVRLENLAREFLTGHAAMDPRPHACDYCHLAGLCRIAELGASLDENAADE